MDPLHSIPGIGKTSLELLEAAGFQNAETLANANVPELTRELERANSILKIAKHAPTSAKIEKWIVEARKLVGLDEQSPHPAGMPINHEINPQVVAMLADAPLAIPLPARTLVDHQLGVADIPSAILLNRYSGDLDIRISQRPIPNRQTQATEPPKPNIRIAEHNVRIAESHSARLEMDTSKVRSTDSMGDPTTKLANAPAASTHDRVALIRTPRVATNKGKDPRSRWYIRGVLHSHPLSIYFGALATLLVMFMIPLSMICSALLLASVELPEHFGWVPEWLLALPVALPLFGIVYLILGLGGTCRVCGQKLFAHRSHLKNTKAHHVRGLGYILPLCIQILLFRWFRCTHCGTPVRLKE